MNTKREFGSRIRGLRRARGIRQKALAKKIGVGKSYMCKIEAGMVVPSERTIQRLAKALDWNATELAILAGRVPSKAMKTYILDMVRAIEGSASMARDLEAGAEGLRMERSDFDDYGETVVLLRQALQLLEKLPRYPQPRGLPGYQRNRDYEIGIG